MHKSLVVAFLVMISMACHPREIAITFDDAPRPDTNLYTGAERTNTLINSLQSVNVEAMFFVVGQVINNENLARLQQYSDAGHKLANHSYSHQSANRVAANIFVADFEKSHQTLATLPAYVQLFRYPFLHKGDTNEKQTAIYTTIKSHGYRIGYVTVDNFDWYMDTLLQQAIQQEKTIDYDKLKSLYIDVLWQSIQFYDDLAIQVLGRSPKHVLLLHENDLAALYVDDLIKHIRDNGWQIITPLEAYTDAIANYSENEILGSQGRIAELAAAKGIATEKLRHYTEDQNYLTKLFEKENIFK